MVTWQCNCVPTWSHNEGGVRGHASARSDTCRDLSRHFCLTPKALTSKTAIANHPNLSRVLSRLVVVCEGNYASNRHRLPQSW